MGLADHFDAQSLPMEALSALDEALAREAATLQLRSSLQRLLEQTCSPLSAIRQEAWQSCAKLINQALSDGTQRQEALLAALRLEWPLMLTRLHEALGSAAAAATAAASPQGGLMGAAAAAAASSDWAAASRSVSPAELAAAVAVLQVACLLHPPARLDVSSLLLKPLLELLQPGGSPPLQIATLDALLASQAHQPEAFTSFCAAGGVEALCSLLASPASSDPVKARSARSLNLLLTHLAPALLPEEAMPAPTPGGGVPSTPLPAPDALPKGLDEAQAAAWKALAGAREAVAAALGREARAMLLRRIPLDDPSAERKLGDLASAMSIFVEGGPA